MLTLLQVVMEEDEAKVATVVEWQCSEVECHKKSNENTGNCFCCWQLDVRVLGTIALLGTEANSRWRGDDEEKLEVTMSGSDYYAMQLLAVAATGAGCDSAEADAAIFAVVAAAMATREVVEDLGNCSGHVFSWRHN